MPIRSINFGCLYAPCMLKFNGGRMREAIYPGSFDPVTLGHLDVMKRSLDIFDSLIVVVMKNNNKKPMFSAEERVALIKKSAEEIGIPTEKLKVMSNSGLLVDFAKECGSTVIVKGLRAVSDFENEFQMAAANQKLSPGLDSVFIMTRAEYMYLSSSIVREVSYYGGDISHFVTPSVQEAVKECYRRQNG